MQIICQKTLVPSERYDLTVLPFWEGPLEAADLKAWKGDIAQILATGDFKGKMGDTAFIYGRGRILLLGLGKKESALPEILRRSFASAIRAAASKKVKTLQIIFPDIPAVDREAALRAAAEGILLANYAFVQLKNQSLKDNPSVLLEKAVILGLEGHEALLSRLARIAAGVYQVRDLVNGNADDVTPRMLADIARSMEKQTAGLELEILDKSRIEKEKMGLLLAVSRGSMNEPFLITLSYRGNPQSKDLVALVGKGITYDTGGLALKPADNMSSMKSDMAGAATVLSAVQTAAALQLKINVTAVAPVTENAIDARSYKNGDVYRSMSGKTVEITNTDAEGRLILADAMTYAIQHFSPTVMVDVASLTGGIVIALGEEIAGLFTNDEKLAVDLAAAAQSTGENLWRMPLHADYTEMLKSEIADLLNSAGKLASSTTAALFLQEFCQPVPWAHIDFAGCCYQTKPKYYYPTKATGFGVRLLIDFLERRST